VSIEERVLNLEKFAADVREHTRFLTEIVRRYDERLDEHDGMFAEAEHASHSRQTRQRSHTHH
jgi:hypothetical protein